MTNKRYYPQYTGGYCSQRTEEDSRDMVNRYIHDFRRDLKRYTGADNHSDITKAFKELRKKGWVARMNFTCCGSCGCAELESKYGLKDDDKFVFFHQQGFDHLKEYGKVHLVWGGTVEDGGELVDILDKFGLFPVWNGSVDRTVRIHLPSGLVDTVFGQFDNN
jgi:hypothetical protein